jgi:hypothetical protein
MITEMIFSIFKTIPKTSTNPKHPGKQMVDDCKDTNIFFFFFFFINVAKDIGSSNNVSDDVYNG